MRAFPHVRDLVTDVSWNFEVKKKIQKFTPRPPDAADGTWRMQQQDVDRVQEFRKCIECFLCQDVCHVLRDHHKHDEFIGPRFLVYAAALEMHPLDVADRVPDAAQGARHRLLQHHQVLHQGVSGAHHDHRQRDHPAQGARGRRVLRSDRQAGEDLQPSKTGADPATLWSARSPLVTDRERICVDCPYGTLRPSAPRAVATWAKVASEATLWHARRRPKGPQEQAQRIRPPGGGG